MLSNVHDMISHFQRYKGSFPMKLDNNVIRNLSRPCLFLLLVGGILGQTSYATLSIFYFVYFSFFLPLLIVVSY